MNSLNSLLDIRSIMVVDDHPLMVISLSAFLKDFFKNASVVATANDGHSALDLIKKHKPDLITLDIGLPKFSGLNIVRQIRQEQISSKILIYSQTEDREILKELVDLGVDLLLRNTAEPTIIHAAFESLQKNQRFIDPAVELLLKTPDTPEKYFPDLTVKENEVLVLIAKGLSNKEIASNLNLSENTIKTHRASILKKLNIKNTAALVGYYFHHKGQRR